MKPRRYGGTQQGRSSCILAFPRKGECGDTFIGVEGLAWLACWCLEPVFGVFSSICSWYLENQERRRNLVSSEFATGNFDSRYAVDLKVVGLKNTDEAEDIRKCSSDEGVYSLSFYL